MDRHRITSGTLSATVNAEGAELCSLRAADGREYLWQAGPVWPRHAPVLFPIVGRLKGDTLRHDGSRFTLKQHGFARDLAFRWVERSAARARLELADDERTRAMYPFAFRLELTYEVAGATLTQTFRVINPGETALPASLGAHPAFVWPLAPGIAKAAHSLTFEAAETGPLRRLDGGLLLPEPAPSPIEGRTLALSEALFAQDALILNPPSSSWVRYSAPGAAAITVSWEAMSQLGIWSKPGDFVCIEPWRGFASPAEFDGEFATKPGVSIIPPGETLTASLTITISSNPD